ncbi:uncharacterized protein LOC142319179 [Lycorma delicatula]|uniref:uncharacterized protein LOC142319179 n=1 Tax=Lycorma delicatula TaxID=130591 RepID=UPI003F518CE9
MLYQLHFFTSLMIIIIFTRQSNSNKFISHHQKDHHTDNHQSTLHNLSNQHGSSTPKDVSKHTNTKQEITNKNNTVSKKESVNHQNHKHKGHNFNHSNKSTTGGNLHNSVSTTSKPKFRAGAIIDTPVIPCPEGQKRDRFGHCRSIFQDV